jgi:hypothetical protein
MPGEGEVDRSLPTISLVIYRYIPDNSKNVMVVDGEEWLVIMNVYMKELKKFMREEDRQRKVVDRKYTISCCSNMTQDSRRSSRHSSSGRKWRKDQDSVGL